MVSQQTLTLPFPGSNPGSPVALYFRYMTFDDGGRPVDFKALFEKSNEKSFSTNSLEFCPEKQPVSK